MDTTKWHIFQRNLGRLPFPTRRLQWPPSISPRGTTCTMFPCRDTSGSKKWLFFFLCVLFENKIWYSVFPVTSARVSVGFPCHPCNHEWQGSTLRWRVITGWVIYGNKVRMNTEVRRMKQWVIFKADRFIITPIMVTVEKWMVAIRYPTRERTKNGDYARTSFETLLGDTHKLPCRCGGPAGTCEGNISGSEGSASLAGSEGTGHVKRFLGRRHSFGWQTKGLWEWPTSKEKFIWRREVVGMLWKRLWIYD